MQLLLKRLRDNGRTTIGDLSEGDFKVVSLEDTYHKEKIYGETRIPAGEYTIKLMKIGEMHRKYINKFPFHQGMLWLQDVPGFSNIYIHIGNSKKDTKGCILLGTKTSGDDLIIGSTTAYTKLYLRVIDAMKAKERVTIKIEDNE